MIEKIFFVELIFEKFSTNLKTISGKKTVLKKNDKTMTNLQSCIGDNFTKYVFRHDKNCVLMARFQQTEILFANQLLHSV